MTDTEILHKSADELHKWLKKWPHKGGMGKESTILLTIDGIHCQLKLTPLRVVNNRRIGRIKAWLTRLKKTQNQGVYDDPQA